MESLALSPKSANQDLIPDLTAVSSPRMVILASQSGISWPAVEGNPPDKTPVFPYRKVTLPKIILSFVYDFLVLAPFCL